MLEKPQAYDVKVELKIRLAMIVYTLDARKATPREVPSQALSVTTAQTICAKISNL